MKKTLLAVMLAAAFAPSVAMAEAGDIVVRARVVNISPDEDSGPFTGSLTAPLLGMANTGHLTVDNNTILEVDFSYYLTKNIALELILATGSEHDVKLQGSSGGAIDQNLGKVDALPPTLTVQWHFNPDQMIDPYIGAGVNYTRFLDKNLSHSVAGNIEVDRNSFGPALQFGVDVNLQDGWLINADIKKIWIDTDVKLRGNGGSAPGPLAAGKIDDLDIDPWVFGIGIGKKF
jgi:outer membrane protein